MLRSPASPTLLKFTLAVSEPSGRTSAGASVLIPVAVPPIAVIDAGFPSLVYPSQRVILNGAGSSDPNGSGIASYDWTVSPASIAVTPLAGGLVQLDMPATPGTPVIVTTQLSVVNGLTLRSPTVQASFQLTNVSAPSWSLDAGLSQTVGSGSIVTISALATSPVPGTNFVYDWSPASETTGDAGAPDWLLTNPNSATTTFVAPKVEGPTPRPITLTVRATETTGVLAPSVRTASVVVNVIDRRRPQILATSVVSGVQGISSGFVLFDEDIDPTAISGITVTPATGSPNTFMVEKKAVGPRVSFALRPPAAPGFMYTFGISNISDLAPAPPNQLTPNVTLPFIPQVRWTAAWESSSTSTSDLFPGLVVRRQTPTAPVQVFVFGRKENTSWFAAPFDPFSCTTPPCVISDDPGAPAVALGGPGARGRHGVLLNGEPIATLQHADFQGSVGVAYRNTGGSWQPLPAAPGALFTVQPNTVLSSAFVDDGGLRVATLDGGTWSTVATMSTNTTEYAVVAAGDPLVVPALPSATGYYLAAKGSTSGQARIFNSVNGTTFFSDGPYGTSADRIADMRPAMQGASFGLMLVLLQSGALQSGCWGQGTCGLNALMSGVTNFDTAGSNGSTSIYIAASLGGTLELYVLGGGQNMPVRVPGPLRAGLPSTMLNNDPSCFADRPELFVLEGMLFVVWEERCAPGPWKVYVRALD